MDDVISAIVLCNKKIFGDNPDIDRINVGFTNTIFFVNNKYVVKICNDKSNENNFKKEIDFYISNKNNELIPRLYYYDIEKKDVNYYYEIIEKVNGTSLYNIWHTINEKERENVIHKLCDAMKKIHSNTTYWYDWNEYISNKFHILYEKVLSLNLFNELELKKISMVSEKFNLYLDTSQICLVHNDLHFDNIIYNNGNIKIIDFERSVYAPIDYELGIIYRMVRKPWKFASEEVEKYTNIEDYKNIMSYIKKYYPEMFMIDYLYKRLAIYDLLYYLKQYIEYPDVEELKDDIFDAINIINE